MTALPKTSHCLELFSISPDALKLSAKDRKDVVFNSLVKHTDGVFKKDELAKQATMTLGEEAFSMLYFLIVLGGGPFLLCMGLAALVFGTWLQFAAIAIVYAVLATHPLPKNKKYFQEHRATLALYKYFSYRFVWSDDDLEKIQSCGAWVGASPPHGVLPIANVLSMAAINAFAFTEFVGAPASVVPKTPFLRYMCLPGYCEVDGKSITKTVNKGISVGLVPDGIAGIFKGNDDDEVVYLKNRKGLAKLALKTGAPIVPAYSLGNTAAYSLWYDRWGLLEKASRAMQASVFLFWGRLGLAIPYRVNITMLLSAPVVVEKMKPEDITQERIDEVHQMILDGIETAFNRHKDACGWGHLKLRFE